MIIACITPPVCPCAQAACGGLGRIMCMQVLSSRSILNPTAMAAAHNAVCRVLARSSALQAYLLLESMVTGKGKMRVEIETVSHNSRAFLNVCCAS